MHGDSIQLLHEGWLFRLNQFDKLIVGFSGGLDSTVLLHALASFLPLQKKLLAVHINHGISINACSWQQHCEQFCYHLGIDFIADTVHFDRSANIEEHARIARYAVFSRLLTERDCLVLGHHQNDQAETVLLQLLRGAGIDGLAAMVEEGPLGQGTLVRPFLMFTRTQLVHYAVLHRLSWIEDESNQNMGYSRNYVRQHIIPLLAAKWPGAVGNIARAATHCQQAKSNLDALAVYDYPGLFLAKNSLLVTPLVNLEFGRIINILRVWLKKRRVQLPSAALLGRVIEELIFARVDAVPNISWGTNIIRRYQNYLYLDKKNSLTLPKCTEWATFPSPLMLEGTGVSIIAEQVTQGLLIPPGAKILIRFRQGGETFFLHGQTKKLKKLFQEWQIPPWLRDRVPLVYLNDDLAAVINYAISDTFFNKDDKSIAWSLSVK